MFNEFKKFAMRGNIVDLAIGIIIGGAFQKIVSSLVNDIVMPLISILTGKVDFTNLKLTIGEISINYGIFLTSVIDFILIAFSIFLIIKYLNKLQSKIEDIPTFELDKEKRKIVKKKKAEVIETPTTKSCPYCYSEININATKCPHCTSNLNDFDKK